SNGLDAMKTLSGKLKELPISFVRALSYTIQMVVKHGDSQVSLEVLDVMVRHLFQVLQFQDHEVDKSAIWALANISYKVDTEKFIHDLGILPLVFNHLNDDDDQLLKSALTVLANTAVGDNARKQSVIDLGTLEILPGIMEEKAKNSEVIKRCCGLLSSVMAGTEDQLQYVINNGFLPKIVKVMQTGHSDCQKQCCLALYFLVRWGTKAQILSLLTEKPMPALPAVLTHANHECIYHALRMIYKLLSTVNGIQLDTLKEEAEESGVVGHLKILKENTNEKVQNLASKIVSEYFAENDNEVVNVGCEKKDPMRRR
ncbi:hypothetical protein PMAYCL1PPCAC_26450, partial [Pristionchus mayeri]